MFQLCVARYAQGSFPNLPDLILSPFFSRAVGHAVVRGAKRQLTGPENKGGVSRGEKEGLIPFQTPEKGLTPANGYRTSYL